MRTFIAAEIPGHIREALYERVRALQKAALPVKWVGCANLHITLKFLGEITNEGRQCIVPHLEKISALHGPFTVVLKGFGCFPNARRPRVAWVGVDQGSNELGTLARDIEESLVQCGFPEEGRFHAHLTIGRTKRPCSLEDILGQPYASEPFSVNTLALFRSTLTPQGAVYEALDTFRLAKD